MKVSFVRVSAVSLVPVAMAFSNGLDHLRSPEHLSSAYQYEELGYKPNQQTNHTLSWMSFRGKHVQTPKVPQRLLHGTCSRALLASLIPNGGDEVDIGSTWQGASRFVCVIQIKLTASNSHWEKRVGQKQHLSCNHCFIVSAVKIQFCQ